MGWDKIPAGYIEIRPGVYERIENLKRTVLRDAIASCSRPAERPVLNEPVETAEGKAENSKRFRGLIEINIIHRRSRLADPDGLCCKYIVDCLVMSGLVRDDSAKYVSVKQSQEKVKSKAEEETIIELYHHEPA